MNTGRYSYNAVQRSILRPLKRHGGLAGGFSSNYDCALVNLEDGDDLVTSAATVVLQPGIPLELVFYRVCNQIYAQYGVPRLINAVFLCPQDSEEKQTARLAEDLAKLCSEENIVTGMVTASVSSAVTEGVVSLQAAGIRDKVCEDKSGEAPAAPGAQNASAAAGVPGGELPQGGSTLMMTGHVGMAGTGVLAARGERELTERYTPGFIRQGEEFLSRLSLRKLSETLKDTGTVLFPLQEGGILGALWNFADGIGAGMDVDIKKLPIRQETVEISEFYNVNPYALLSDGACLIAAQRPGEVQERLAREGIRCAVIGRLTSERTRILRRDDEIRYLDKPARDEIWSVLQGQQRRNGS